MYTSKSIRIAAMAAVIAAVVLAGCSERRSAQFTEQGNTHLVLGNFEEASAAFDRALAANPKNAEAKLGQARCLWVKKDADSAWKAYQEAIALNPALEKAYMEAVRVALSRQDVKGAEELGKQFAGVKADDGGILQAFILRETDRAGEAVTLLADLKQKFPKSVEVRVNLASALIAAQRAPEAEAELKQTLAELDPDSMPARMLLVEAYEEQGKLSDIESELRALAEKRPDDAGVQLSFARSLVASRKFDEAEKIARPILEKTPESPWANYVVGACLLQHGKYDEAASCLQAASGALPNDPQIGKLLALAQGGGKPAGAQNTGETTSPAPQNAGNESAVTWMSLWRDASFRQLLQGREAYLAANESNCAETVALAAVFAQEVPLARQLGEKLPADSPVAKYIAALVGRDPKALKDAIDSWQETVPARKLLRENAEGFALALGGARAQALRLYSQCLQEFPESGVAYYNVASMYRNAGMPKFAIGALKQLISRHANNLEARQILFETMLEADLLDEARRQAESTFALFPSEPASLLNLARVYRDAGDYGLAEDVLRKGMERVSDKTPLTFALIELLLAKEQADPAETLLREIPQNDGNKQRVALINAMLAAQRNRWDDVLARCTEVAGPGYPLPTRLLHVAAVAKTGKLEQAGEPLRMADGQPRTGPTTNVILRALGVMEDPLSKDDESLAEALKGNTEALAYFAYAMALREMSMDSAACTMFRTVDEKIPGQPRLVELAMSSAARANEMQERSKVAEHFTGKYPDMAAAWIGTGDIQHALNDDSGQKASLEKAAQVEPANDLPWRRLLAYYGEKDDYPQLLEVCKHLVALEPDDAYAANNLAYCILQTGGSVDEALALAQKASVKLPRNPDVAHTLGLALTRTGNLDEGSKNLTSALEMRPGDPTLMLDYGKLLLDQKKTEEGKNHIQLALRYASQLGIDFPRRTEAEQALAQGKS